MVCPSVVATKLKVEVVDQKYDAAILDKAGNVVFA
jgi:hypothetical protein